MRDATLVKLGQHWRFVENEVVVVLVLVAACLVPCNGYGCDDGCSPSSPFCCALLDGTSLCCPYGTACDTTYGCVLSDRGDDAAASRRDDQGRVRTPLHESITSVYFTIGLAARMVLYAAGAATTLFVLACVHRTLVIKVQRWAQRRSREAESSSSSDEDVVEVRSDSASGASDSEQELRTTEDAAIVGGVPVTDEKTGDGNGTCMACTRPIDCVLLRCNHTAVCIRCARSIAHCPKCHEKIHRRQKLFFV